MRQGTRNVVFCTLVLGAWLGSLQPELAKSAPKPALALDKITVSNERATGELRGGGRAELTIQPHLQQAARKLLHHAHPRAGAAILVDLATGELLVFQGYRRNRGANPLTELAPAASLFKLVTTTTLLEKSPVTPNSTVCISGGRRQILREHLERPRPDIARCGPFGEALGHSRNAAFAQLATRHLMRDDLVEVAQRLGFNRALPFDAPAKMGSADIPYNDLEFARTAAGFIGTSVSPLGAVYLASTIALGGRPPRLRLLRQDASGSPRVKREWGERAMKENTAWRLTRMMEVTVHSGTSLEAFTNPQGQSYLGDIRVAGKTGTLKRGKTSPTTSWFLGFAPSRKPLVAVTVLLQNGKVWRRRANEVARDLLRVYFASERGVTSPFDQVGTKPTAALK